MPRVDARRLHRGRLPDAGLPGNPASGRCASASGARRKARWSWEEVHASPILDSAGQPAAGGGGVARHLGAARGGGAPGRVAPAGVAGHAGVGILARAEHAAGHRADVRGGHPARDARTATDAARIRESATIAREQILRCRGITQHFLRMSRGQRSQGEVVDLAPVIAAVARLIEPTAREHSVKVEVRPLPAGMHVRADEAELQHTLINLLLNAVQASPAGRPGDGGSRRGRAGARSA